MLSSPPEVSATNRGIAETSGNKDRTNRLSIPPVRLIVNLLFAFTIFSPSFRRLQIASSICLFIPFESPGSTFVRLNQVGEVFTGQRKGDLPGVHFLSRELFDEIRASVFEHFNRDVERLGYGDAVAAG